MNLKQNKKKLKKFSIQLCKKYMLNKEDNQEECQVECPKVCHQDLIHHNSEEWVVEWVDKVDQLEDLNKDQKLMILIEEK